MAFGANHIVASELAKFGLLKCPCLGEKETIYLFPRSHPASVTNKRRISRNINSSLEWNPIRWMKGVALYQEGNWFVYDYAGYRRREKHLQTKAQYGGL